MYAVVRTAIPGSNNYICITLRIDPRMGVHIIATLPVISIKRHNTLIEM